MRFSFCSIIYVCLWWAHGLTAVWCLLLGHVNNVSYIRYAESSRIWYFRRLGQYVPLARRKEWDELMSPRGLGLILKSISVDFLFVLFPPPPFFLSMPPGVV